VPRERFVPEDRAGLAYSDITHRLSSVGDRVLSTPEAFARLAQLGGIGPDDVVLDIACGTGYSTAVLAKVASAVVALEDDADLVARTDALLTALEIGNAAVLTGALTEGVAAEAPFDVIIVEGAVEAIPEKLFGQLKDGGRLVAGVLRGRTVVATRFLKSDGVITPYESFDISLPVLGAFVAPEQFAL